MKLLPYSANIDQYRHYFQAMQEGRVKMQPFQTIEDGLVGRGLGNVFSSHPIGVTTTVTPTNQVGGGGGGIKLITPAAQGLAQAKIELTDHAPRLGTTVLGKKRRRTRSKTKRVQKKRRQTVAKGTRGCTAKRKPKKKAPKPKKHAKQSKRGNKRKHRVKHL